MEIFISWSGDVSKCVAMLFHQWLPRVIQCLRPWFSDADIGKGVRWASEISQKLDGINFGIICVTRENVNAPWLLFEAGAISKIIGIAKVCPVLLDIEKSEMSSSPLSQFQMTEIDKSDMFKLLKDINKCLPGTSVSEDILKRTFEKFWPEFEKIALYLKSFASPSLARQSDRQILEELMKKVCSIEKTVGAYLIDRPKGLRCAEYLRAKGTPDFKEPDLNLPNGSFGLRAASMKQDKED